MAQESGDVSVPILTMQALGERLFVALGVPQTHARLTVETLIEADLRGVVSHGVAHLAGFYLRRILRERINRTPNIRIVSEAPAAAVIDGDLGLGFVVAHQAIDLAMEKARSAGVGFVSVKNSTHYGAGFHYALKAARRDMIGISITTGGNIVVPPGAKKPAYGANVISVAAPTGKGFEYVLDGSTSVVAGGKLEIAARRGASIPEGWALDESGAPTTDPTVLSRGGGLLPLGGSPQMGAYKGFGLGIFADVMSGVLSGAGASLTLPPTGAASHLLAAIRIDAFEPTSEFIRNIDVMIDGLKAAERQPGVDEILIPGEMEARLERQRRAEGAIPVHPAVIESLRTAAEIQQVPFDLA
ncbi:MAG: Ldh family oxidoreductase [Dehalococcoidia bacterium]